ncbi:MAG: alpha/beta hydrolase [Planctomycetota bacterium]|nr:alpha/beta hydrolase [Planctomycetota bacterium]
MPAQLHHLVRTSPSSSCEQGILILHGILGSGANWGGFARELVRFHPDRSVVAVDMRHHGRSGTGSPPDSVEACVSDLMAWLSTLEIQLETVIGHSFGSKVALILASRLDSVQQVMLLDADPGPLPLEGVSRAEVPVLRLLDLLRKAPKTYGSRDHFQEVLASGGFGEAVAGWVGKNLRRLDDQLVLTLDIDRVEAMLADHHRIDGWGLIESHRCQRISLCVGGKSRVVSPAAQKRMRGLQQNDPDRYSLEVIEDAGHWLHVDAPERLLDFVGNRLLR